MCDLAFLGVLTTIPLAGGFLAPVTAAASARHLLRFSQNERRSYAGPLQMVIGRRDTAMPTSLGGGDYRVKSIIGTGGNAVTYRCEEKKEQRGDVAVKVLTLRGMKSWKDLDLLEREAAILQQLDHPTIPKYLDYFEEDHTAEDRRFCLVQQLAAGKSLAAMVAAGWRPQEAEVLRIARELLGVLSYLEQLKPPVVHRDIKPENVVLEGGLAGGRVFLVDFGGVQGIAQSEAANTIVGTFGFMAPEQFMGAARPSSDLYSLGATLLFLLTGGKQPADFPKRRFRVDVAAAVSCGDVTEALLQGLLEPFPEDRLTAQQALAMLDSGLRPVPPPPPASPLGQWRQTLSQALGRIPGQSLSGLAAAAAGTGSSAAASSSRASPAAGAAAASEQADETALAMPRAIEQPVGARSRVSRRGLTLECDIPPKRAPDMVFTGTFALAWNAFVVLWTTTALAGGGILFAVFSLPFWAAGFQLGKRFTAGLLREHVEIGASRWRLQQQLAFIGGGGEPEFFEPKGPEADFDFRGRKQTGGRTRDLVGCRVVSLGVINGTPQTAIEIVEGLNRYAFGEGLSPDEQVWLTDEINAHIALCAAANNPPAQPVLPALAAPSGEGGM